MWKSLLLSALVLSPADSAGLAADPGDKQVRDLVAVFQNPKNSSDVRTTAVRALGALGWPTRDDVPDLIKFLDDPEERKEARESIGPYLAVIEAVGRLGPVARTAVPTLVKAKGIAAPYDQAIDAALESILLPAPGTVYSLLGSLRDNDPAVRLLAARTLRNYPVEYVVVAPVLRESAAKDPDADVRRVVGETLKVLTKAEVDRLVALLKDPDANVRVLAAKALGHMGADAKDALPALKGARDNPKEDADVRAVAGNAIKKIDEAKP
jgi:HEAT repeat protein